MWEIPPGHPLERMFAGLTEHAFQTTLGVADPPLVDYLSQLLSRFVHLDAVHRLRGRSGVPLTGLVEMLVEADKLPAEGVTRREYHRHIGDTALFWAGVFPESVQRNRPPVSVAALGKRSYLIASDFDGEGFRNEAPVLRRLGEQFELCAYGLREVRREWEELAQQPMNAGALIR